MSEPPSVVDRHFKIAVVGPGNMGKSALVKRVVEGQPFNAQNYRAKGIQQMDDLVIATKKHGPITFEIWDTAGQDELDLDGEDDPLYGCDGALVIFTRESFANTRNALRLVGKWRKIYGKDCVVVLACNKIDLDGTMTEQDKNAHQRYIDMAQKPCCFVSVKNDENVWDPLLELAKQLLNDPTVEFVDANPVPLRQPPVVSLEEAMTAVELSSSLLAAAEANDERAFDNAAAALAEHANKMLATVTTN